MKRTWTVTLHLAGDDCSKHEMRVRHQVKDVETDTEAIIITLARTMIARKESGVRITAIDVG